MPRLLWPPLAPALTHLVRKAPAYPLEATLAGIVLLPFALPLAFVLPGVLTTDAVLQWAYDQYGGALEVLWEDGGSMLRIALESAALGGKETTRLLNQLRLKVKEDPLGVLQDVVSAAANAVAHPFQTGQTLYAYTVPAVDAFFKSLRLSWWIKDPAGGTKSSSAFKQESEKSM